MEITEIQKLLPKFKKTNFAKIFTLADAETSYIDYVNNISNCKVSFAIPAFDNSLGMIRPSQVVTFIAGTNIGKTALALNIIMANAKLMQNRIILLFQLEIDQNELFERFVQMECNVSTTEVENAYLKKTAKIKQFSAVKNKYSNVVSIINRISVDEIIPYCLACKELSGKEIGFIVVDYLGLVKDSRYKDEYSRVTAVMQSFKEIALSLQVPVISLSQPSRQDLKNENGLNLYSGKSSGEIENSSQIVITSERISNDNLSRYSKEISSVDKTTITNLEAGRYFLLKAKVEKKKQGNYSSCLLLFDTKSTVITEYINSNNLVNKSENDEIPF